MTFKKNLTVCTFSMVALLFANQVNAAFPVKTDKAQTEVVASADAPATFAPAPPAADAPKNVTGVKTRTKAALLCFFLGAIGIHRFYLGYPLLGILFLVSGGGVGLFVLIDFVRILLGDLKPKNGEYDA
jgi:TM2 domain-containing membrane protein YozV